MRKILVIVSVVLLFVIGVVVFYPHYKMWKDRQITSSLESKVIPFIQENEITYFVDDICRQIKYGMVEAASPEGCAYIENQTDETKKDIPDFSTVDEKIFDELEDLLSNATQDKFESIELEYPLFYRSEHASLPQTPIGLAFDEHCTFCRVRYVYWPNYEKLPPNIEGEIRYTPIDKNWYRVDQDWN